MSKFFASFLPNLSQYNFNRFFLAQI